MMRNYVISYNYIPFGIQEERSDYLATKAIDVTDAIAKLTDIATDVKRKNFVITNIYSEEINP